MSTALRRAAERSLPYTVRSLSVPDEGARGDVSGNILQGGAFASIVEAPLPTSKPLMRLLALVGLVLLAACSDSNDPDGDEPADIEGSWTWTAEILSTEIELTCTTTGRATIEQSDDQFTGQVLESEGTCAGPEDNVPFDLDGALGSGTIEGSAVSFEGDRCEYTGVAIGDPVDQIEGDVTCTFVFNNNDETVTFDGSWAMTR